MNEIEIKINNWDKYQQSKDQQTDKESFPKLSTLSGAFFYRFLPCPVKVADPEFVYVDTNQMPHMNALGLIADWNLAWEAGQFRTDICSKDLPEKLNWLKSVEDRNIYLIPEQGQNKFAAYAPLYHLLPSSTLERFGLPRIKHSTWPVFLYDERDAALPRDFNDRISRAFAHHIWPLLNGQSNLSSFTDSEPLKFLAHNLNYWLPYIYKVAENRMNCLNRVPYENDEDRMLIERIQSQNSSEVVQIKRPLMGGAVWYGEDDAWEATNELIELADKKGQLRSIIDAIKSNRVEEDFSDRWSYAREDFERKLYSKRSKVKVRFVELDETIPVHSHESEVHENLLWENFFAVLNPKEKQIVVCLRNGSTNLTEIAKELGYANHSPISKALVQIRNKANKLLSN